jgi:hypothetical protein
MIKGERYDWSHPDREPKREHRRSNRTPNWSWKDILAIVAVGVIANILILAIPGFYSHDERVRYTRSRQSRNGLSSRLQRVDPVRIACRGPN